MEKEVARFTALSDNGRRFTIIGRVRQSRTVTAKGVTRSFTSFPYYYTADGTSVEPIDHERFRIGPPYNLDVQKL